MSAPQAYLKRSPARSVRREPGAGEARAAVVKRFQRGGPLAAWHDRARARREFEMLRWLTVRGVSVPEPLGLERTAGGWEVRMRAIDGARTLEQVWRAGEAREGGPGNACARGLGRLIAALHDSGVAHPDPHPGNVLVDSLGRLFALDFHKARRARWSAARLAAQWSALEATARELLPRPLRARVLAAYRRALSASLRALFDRVLAGDGLTRIEAAGRALRRATVERRRLRWTRASSSCRVCPADGALVWCRRELDDGLLSAVRARAGALAPSESIIAAQARHGELRVLRDGTWRELAPIWYAAARLEEHGLAAARPFAACTRPRPWIALELPRGARALAPGRLGDRAGAWGALAGAFWQRGLRLPAPTRAEFFELEGALVLGPLPRLERDDGPARAAARHAWRAIGNAARAPARAARADFFAAFARSAEIGRAVGEAWSREPDRG